MLLDNSETESVFSSRTSVQLFFTIYLSVNQTILFYESTFFSKKTFYVRLLRLSFFSVKPDFRGFFECRGELNNEHKRLNIATTFDFKSNGGC